MLKLNATARGWLAQYGSRKDRLRVISRLPYPSEQPEKAILRQPELANKGWPRDHPTTLDLTFEMLSGFFALGFAHKHFFDFPSQSVGHRWFP